MEILVFLVCLSVAISLLALWTVAETVKSVTVNVETLIKASAVEIRRDHTKLNQKHAETVKKLSRLDKETQIAIQDFSRSRKRQDDEMLEVRAWFKEYEDSQRFRKSA